MSPVWGTLAIDYPNPNPEIISSWLKKSKSRLLDVYIDDDKWRPCFDHPRDVLSAISKLVYNELPRIRSLFATDNFLDIFSTFPTICDGHTILPRMENLNLLRFNNFSYCREWKARFSFPLLRTLILRDFEVLIDGSMPQNVHHLDITEYTPRSGSLDEDEDEDTDSPCWTYQLLQTVHNVVSLTWSIHLSSDRLEPPVVLPCLKFLSLPSYWRYRSDTLEALECFIAPSLENLDLDIGCYIPPQARSHEEMLKEALDVICRDGSVQLRHLTVCCSPKSVDLYAMSPHLNHL